MSEKRQRKIRKLISIYRNDYNVSLSHKKLTKLWYSVSSSYRDWQEFETVVHIHVVGLTRK